MHGLRHVQFSIQSWIQDCCNIQDGALCDNNQRLEAISYYHKALHLGCCSSPRCASVVYIVFLLYYCICLSTISVIHISSHPEVFLRKGVLKICSKFTGEHLCRSAIMQYLCNVLTNNYFVYLSSGSGLRFIMSCNLSVLSCFKKHIDLQYLRWVSRTS